MSRPRRNTHHLPGYDYAQPGAYFLTTTLHRKAKPYVTLSTIVEDRVRLTHYGVIVTACWNDLPAHYPHVQLDAFVVMPDHVHGIIILTDDSNSATTSNDVGAGLRPAPTVPTEPTPPTKPAPTTHDAKRHALPEIVRAFKSFSARRINNQRGTLGTPFWQRGYYEHVIRNEDDLHRVRQYIADNPIRWALDGEEPL